MAGLLAWAADVVGANESGSDVSDDPSSIPLILTPQQQQYLTELNQKSASLTRSIQDLRLRLPPSDIAQRLPHLHAHSLASNAAFALQLDSHSSTREQAQQREVKLLEENAAYEKEITKCEAKIQEKLQEAEQFQQKLKELDSIEENLKAELQRVQAASSTSQSDDKAVVEHEKEVDTEAEEDASRTALLEKLENQKKEMQLMEEKIQVLEKKWTEVQEKALKQPSPAQREKALDKQLHSLMEQLAAKQAQAESLMNEIHIKEKELERLNALWRRVENAKEATAARNRFARSGPTYGYETDTELDGHNNLPYHSGGRSEHRQRLRILRSSFVLYVFLLHIIVFIRISFI